MNPNRWKQWGDKPIFVRMMHGLAAEAAVPKTVLIASHGLLRNQLPGNGRDLSQGAPIARQHMQGMNDRGTATSLRAKKRGPDDQGGRLIGRTQGGMNTKQHAVTPSDR